MRLISFHESAEKEHWLSEIKRSDWRAGPFLCELLSTGKFFDVMGEGSRVLLLTNEDELISYCIFAGRDDIPDTELTPWIGFVYTFPEHRGHRYIGVLFDEIERIMKAGDASAGSMASTGGGSSAARVRGVYLSTNHIGLYEKYGFEYMTDMIDMDGNPSRIYVKRVVV